MNAFNIISVDLSNGETTIVVQKNIIGALANQLKSTNTRRKMANTLRKLGYMLTECGNVHYGTNVNETNLDPNLIKNSPSINQ